MLALVGGLEELVAAREVVGLLGQLRDRASEVVEVAVGVLEGPY